MADIKEKCFLCDNDEIEYHIPNALCEFKFYCLKCKKRIMKEMKKSYEAATNFEPTKKRKHISYNGFLIDNLNYIINNVKEIKKC